MSRLGVPQVANDGAGSIEYHRPVGRLLAK
jgi:hypothetical protein